MTELPKSVIFDTEQKYLSYVRNNIAILEEVIRKDEDVMIEGPMATRILLDFYCETLRRTLEYGKKKDEKGGSNNE